MKLNNIVLNANDFANEMAKLRNEKHFDFLVTIIGEDFGEEGFGCIYILENTQTYERISVKVVAADRNNPFLPSVTHLWKAADLMEREVYDFFGIKFVGHPDMRRLYLRSDFKGYPLRKDYDMDPEKNKPNMFDDPEPDYTLQYSLDKDGNLVENRHKLFGEDDYVVNIGPQHPATHGVLRLQTILDGEVIRKIYPHLGYIHRGVEKISESYTYPQTLAFTDRLDYLSATMNRHALVGVIEEAMEVELTDRIKYIRTIMDELQRLNSHLLFYSCCAQDVGALTAFIYGMRDREQVINVMEETTTYPKLLSHWWLPSRHRPQLCAKREETLRLHEADVQRISRCIHRQRYHGKPLQKRGSTIARRRNQLWMYRRHRPCNRLEKRCS